jgi:nitroreductase
MMAGAAIERILDMGRWAPRGDNTQPWRFEIVDDSHVVAHCFDTREHCVYDLDGHPSQISHGALIETLAIAASSHGLRLDSRRRAGMPDTRPTFDLRFSADPSVAPDPLFDVISSRSVQRRPLATRLLRAEEKAALVAAVGADYDVLWLEGSKTKLRTARLMFNNARLRLTLPEAFRVHKDVIEWNQRYSESRVPDQALGVDAATAKVMRFVMHNWERVHFFNRFLAGTWAPRIQMDFLPSMACGAHFLIMARQPAKDVDDYVRAGRALQRFWLTVTRLGLFMQPEMTPLIFSRYAREGLRFSDTPGKDEEARRLAGQYEALVGEKAARNGVYMGRIGAGRAAASRSMRLPLEKLMDRGNAGDGHS